MRLSAATTPITCTVGTLSAPNYTFTAGTTASFTITQRVLTVTATGVNRDYDGTTDATVTLSDDHVGTDDVQVGYTSASFVVNGNAGTAKNILVSGISITGGADAGNYRSATPPLRHRPTSARSRSRSRP